MEKQVLKDKVLITLTHNIYSILHIMVVICVSALSFNAPFFFHSEHIFKYLLLVIIMQLGTQWRELTAYLHNSYNVILMESEQKE